MNSAFKNDTELFKTISKSRHLIFTNNMSSTENKQLTWGHLWLAEAWRFECDADDLTTVECAGLADELWHHKVMADEDLNFFGELLEWTDYIYERDLLLPLEQSCHEGMLLPVDQRAVRLESCPEQLISPLRWFFDLCPIHIQSYIALHFFALVRLDRARHTGNPDWRPSTAFAEPEESVFFRPSKLLFRKYRR